MRVQATKEGFYNQFIHVVGEVFDLLDDPKTGRMPLRMIREYLKDDKGVLTGEFIDEKPYLDKEGNPMHADYAPDEEVVRGTGAFRGESFSPGWMRQVPDDTPLGIYDYAIVPNAARAAPMQRIIQPSDQPSNSPRATPIRGVVDRQFRTG